MTVVNPEFRIMAYVLSSPGYIPRPNKIRFGSAVGREDCPKSESQPATSMPGNNTKCFFMITKLANINARACKFRENEVGITIAGLAFGKIQRERPTPILPPNKETDRDPCLKSSQIVPNRRSLPACRRRMFLRPAIRR